MKARDNFLEDLGKLLKKHKASFEIEINSIYCVEEEEPVLIFWVDEGKQKVVLPSYGSEEDINKELAKS